MKYNDFFLEILMKAHKLLQPGNTVLEKYWKFSLPESDGLQKTPTLTRYTPRYSLLFFLHPIKGPTYNFAPRLFSATEFPQFFSFFAACLNEWPNNCGVSFLYRTPKIPIKS